MPCNGHSAELKPVPDEWTKSVGRRFQHYKGKEYEVVGIASHTETLETVVVYRQLYGAHALWVRPAEMFFEEVEIDGKRVPRFAPVEEYNG